MRLEILTRCFFTLLLFSSTGGPQIAGQSLDQPAIPHSSGSYAVGRHAFHWVDSTRQDFSSSTPGGHRELMVYIWYPAQFSPQASSGEYFPFAAEINKQPAAKDAAQDMFGKSWPQIVMGSIRSHAVTDAPPFNGRFPVILFSHGYSATTFSYTAQIEYFVSHGYVVVAIEHTDAAGIVRFPDGEIRLFRNPPASRTAPTDPLQAMIASAELGTQIGAEDLRFVLDTLKSKSALLSRHMDLSRVAAVGHSYGGTLTARACQIDSRIVACISEDGEVNPTGAFFDYPDHLPIKQPFLLIEIDNHPTDTELARMRETRPQWNAFLAHEREQVDQCGPGSYLVLLDKPGMVHSSFSDGLVLNATDSRQASIALANLQLTEELEADFLDKYLKGMPAPLLDQPDMVPSGVKISRLGK